MLKNSLDACRTSGARFAYFDTPTYIRNTDDCCHRKALRASESQGARMASMLLPEIRQERINPLPQITEATSARTTHSHYKVNEQHPLTENFVQLRRHSRKEAPRHMLRTERLFEDNQSLSLAPSYAAHRYHRYKYFNPASWLKQKIILHFIYRMDAIAFATAFADCGFCPVISRPSMTTFDLKGKKFFS